MVIASKYSEEWIFHCPECGYVNRIHEPNKVYFHTRQEALNYGYNFCLYCSPFTGYHDQHIQKAKIIAILKYAVKHDEYRKTHPLRRKGPPKKGSRNYQKERQKYKHRQKYHEIGEGIHTVRVLCEELEDGDL